jgi:hypothetical protein
MLAAACVDHRGYATLPPFIFDVCVHCSCAIAVICKVMTIAKSTGQKLDLAHKYPNPKPNLLPPACSAAFTTSPAYSDSRA